MDGTIFAVSASTLVDGIHEIKQWVYNGQLRILLSAVVLHDLEESYKASLVVKEQPKDAAPKKPSGRLARREQPLFDINPRTAWEFVLRAKTWSKDGGVVFQGEGEEFTQWKEEDEAQNSKVPPPAPTSFLEALQSKINNQAALDAAAKGPAKPKLISRLNEPKSPWKFQRVPRVDSTIVPQDLRSFFSCVLWKLYESDTNPHEPTRYAVLADDSRIKTVAAALRIPLHTRAEIRNISSVRAQTADHRELSGQLERDFPDAAKASSLQVAPAETYTDLTAPPQPSLDVSVENGTSKSLLGNGAIVANGSAQGMQLGALRKSDSANPLDTLLESLTQTTFSPPANTNPKFSPFESLAASIDAHPALEERKSPPVSERSTEKTSEKETAVSDSESEEDVIVFNPRAKRMSGRPQTPAKATDTGKSRPGTSDGVNSARTESMRSARSPIISTLKPQSPVFTPGKLYVPATEAAPAPSTTSPTRQNGVYPTSIRSPPRSPENNATKTSPSKSQATLSHPRGHSNGQAQRQQSEMIIKRQREAIQRQAKTAPKAPPRQVQMEPTDNPTVIDPDAFDRSYVVQPPTQTPEKPTTRRGGRSRGNPRDGPRARGKAGAEPGDDFVLKSGTPRSAARGKGKLWVP